MKIQLNEKQHEKVIEYIVARARGLMRTPTNTLAWLIMGSADFKKWNAPNKRKAKA